MTVTVNFGKYRAKRGNLNHENKISTQNFVKFKDLDVTENIKFIWCSVEISISLSSADGGRSQSDVRNSSGSLSQGGRGDSWQGQSRGGAGSNIQDRGRDAGGKNFSRGQAGLLKGE